MAMVAGVDGCKAGRLCVAKDLDTGLIMSTVFRNAHLLLQQGPEPSIIAVDIPIGLTKVGPRQCDIAARKLLGPRASSVFPAPIRPALQSKTRQHADEIRSLLEVTKVAPERFGMSGYERALLYRLAVETGLRANELRNLKISSFDFNNLIVTVIAGHTKNKHIATIPLRTDTAGELQSFFTSKMPNTKAFGGRYKKLTDRTAEMLQCDLADANISYQDDAGMYFDFHSFRHEAGSLLAASGTHPKVAQSIMRHSDINLTMSLYTHTLRGQESQAVENLPDLSLPSKGSQKLTGTDNLPVSAYKPAYKKLTKNAYSDRKSMSLNVSDETQRNSGIEQNIRGSKSLQFGDLETKKDQLSPSDIGQKTNGRYRIRTCDPLIKSQLPQNDKRVQNKDLQQDTTDAYKPAYKEDSKTDRKQDKIENTEMPPEIAEIVAIWPELPEHIKAAIKALVQTHTGSKRG